MILAKIVKLKRWTKLRHLVKDGKTLCGLTPLKIHEIKGPIPRDGQTCSNCWFINRDNLIDQYPMEPRNA